MNKFSECLLISSHRINSFMLSWIQKEPEVTPCLIFIQETRDILPYLFDLYLLETAVNKYYIGLCQKYQKFGVRAPATKTLKHVPYPIIQIDHHGLIAIKCPTISGGKWYKDSDISHCHTNGLDIKGQKIKILANELGLDDFNVFWIMLTLVEVLKCNVNFYGQKNMVLLPSATNNSLDLSYSYILPLRKYKNFTIVILTKCSVLMCNYIIYT